MPKLLQLKRTWQIKAVDDAEGIIEAYGSVFDNVDQGDDVVRRGAFKRTIQNAKARMQSGKAKFLAPMLWQHDADQPIGGWLDMSEDSHGLLCKGQIILSTDLGRNAYELIKSGVINEFSIGYDIPKGGAKYDKDSGYRELTELRLWEISVVTFAMNQEALLQSVKANTVMTQKKDFNDHYRQERIQDWLYGDFNNLTSALRASIIDIFSIGDAPEPDVITTILDDTNGNKIGLVTALKNYVQMGIDLDVSNYLQEELQDNNSSSYSYGYMGRDTTTMHVKAGRSISAANAEKINEHIQNMHEMATKAMEHGKAMTEQAKAMHGAADDLATILQGSEAAYGTDHGTSSDGSEGKAATHTDARGADLHSSKNDTADEHELAAALAALRTLKH